ncbi:hypothetical protein D5045_02185 [Verminephrobacter eiseniae]|nr:hypothetical protein [Verminephrobacter eiseniae]
MLDASALNAMAANVYDFDDTHIPTIGRPNPTAPVAPALAALAQSRPVRPVHGRDFLLALVLGVEVECRIANAHSPGHCARGWHNGKDADYTDVARLLETWGGVPIRQHVK